MTGIGLKRKLMNAAFLVSRHGVAWHKAELDEVPQLPGIYALYYGETLQYIGQSINLQKRLKDHDRNHYYQQGDYKPFGNYSWFVIHQEFLDQAEKMLIQYYQSPYNLNLR